MEDLKQRGYKNLKDWIQVDDPSVVGYPMLLTTSSGARDFNNPSLDFQGRNFQAELGKELLNSIFFPSLLMFFSKHKFFWV